MNISSNFIRSIHLALPAIFVVTTMAFSVAHAIPNNAPSFNPGPEPTSSHCDGLVRFPDWALNVTDNDNGTAGLSFHLLEVTNSEIFSKRPHVSWPSHTLSYQLKPGTPGDMTATITAVLRDTSGTGNGGRDTSDPQSWNIYTEYCGEELEAREQAIAEAQARAAEVEAQARAQAQTAEAEARAAEAEARATEAEARAAEAELAATDALELLSAQIDSDDDGISDIDEGNGVVDTDGDDIPDSQDIDSDNDGINDVDENFDSDGDGIRDSLEVFNDDVSTDSDSDGVTDEFDIDDDNDGITDQLEGNGLVDTDADNVPDSLDLDSDNDGLHDLAESGIDLTNISHTEDGVINSAIDNNGYAEALDLAIDGITTATPLADSNEDGIPDFQDTLSLVLADGTPEDSLLRTGVNGGCVLNIHAAKDPLLLLTVMLAFVGLSRRRSRR